MRQLVALEIESHPIFHMMPEPPTTEASAHGIVLRSGPARVEVRGPEWWIPLDEARAFRLAGDLAVELRARLDASDGHPADR